MKRRLPPFEWLVALCWVAFAVMEPNLPERITGAAAAALFAASGAFSILRARRGAP